MRSSPPSAASARRSAPIISASRRTSSPRRRASPTAPFRWALCSSREDPRRLHGRRRRRRSISSTAIPIRATPLLAPPPSPRSRSTRRRGCSPAPAELAPYWQEAVHSLKGLPHVIDIRNIGLIGAIEFEPIPGKPSQARACPLRRGVQPRSPGARHRRHHRAVAAAHHREEGDRPARRNPFRRPQVRELRGRASLPCTPSRTP